MCIYHHRCGKAYINTFAKKKMEISGFSFLRRKVKRNLCGCLKSDVSMRTVNVCKALQ